MVLKILKVAFVAAFFVVPIAYAHSKKTSPTKAFGSPIQIGKDWAFKPTGNPANFQFYMEGSHVTRIEDGALKGVLIAQDYQKMSRQKVLRLMRAAKRPANELQTFKSSGSEVYAFRLENSIFWYSSAGGRVVGSFEELKPYHARALVAQVGRAR